jgi:hypothetical protein
MRPKTLTKIVIKEKSTKKVIMELLPTKKNEVKATNMADMADIEVVRVYEQV